MVVGTETRDVHCASGPTAAPCRRGSQDVSTPASKQTRDRVALLCDSLALRWPTPIRGTCPGDQVSMASQFDGQCGRCSAESDAHPLQRAAQRESILFDRSKDTIYSLATHALRDAPSCGNVRRASTAAVALHLAHSACRRPVRASRLRPSPLEDHAYLVSRPLAPRRRSPRRIHHRPRQRSAKRARPAEVRPCHRSLDSRRSWRTAPATRRHRASSPRPVL